MLGTNIIIFLHYIYLFGLNSSPRNISQIQALFQTNTSENHQLNSEMSQHKALHVRCIMTGIWQFCVRHFLSCVNDSSKVCNVICM